MAGIKGVEVVADVEDEADVEDPALSGIEVVSPVAEAVEDSSTVPVAEAEVSMEGSAEASPEVVVVSEEETASAEEVLLSAELEEEVTSTAKM